MDLSLDYCLSRRSCHGNRCSYQILLFRFFSGLMMLPYGYGKIVDYDRYAADFFGNPLGIGDIPSLWLTIFAQVVCPITLIIGFQTRVSAAILAFNMLVAVKYHFFDSFNVKALPLLFLGMFLLQILWGPGKYSLDYLLYSSNGRQSLSPNERWAVCCVAAAFAVLCVIFSNIFSGWIASALLLPVVILLVISYSVVER